MLPILLHTLFTLLGCLAIFTLCGVALAALPWHLSAQEATERGLLLLAERVVALLRGAVLTSEGPAARAGSQGHAAQVDAAAA